MARAPRLQFEDAFYHIYSRGNRRQRIFWDAEDYREFEDLLLTNAARSDIHLYQWRLMPNHFHFSLETPKANLSIFMQRLLTSYARYINRKYKQVGHVFQGRYGSRVCDKENYFLELLRYIVLNAQRAKNWRKIVARGEDHWSSHRFYIEGNEPEIIRPYVHAVLRRFNDDLPTARLRYADFIAEGLSDPKALRSLPRTVGFLGSDQFIDECRQKAGATAPTISQTTLSLEELVERIGHRFGVSELELQSNLRSGRIARARRVLVHVANFCGISGALLAKTLRKDRSAISHMYRIQGEQSSVDRDTKSLLSEDWTPDNNSTIHV